MNRQQQSKKDLQQKNAKAKEEKKKSAKKVSDGDVGGAGASSSKEDKAPYTKLKQFKQFIFKNKKSSDNSQTDEDNSKDTTKSRKQKQNGENKNNFEMQSKSSEKTNSSLETVYERMGHETLSVPRRSSRTSGNQSTKDNCPKNQINVNADKYAEIERHGRSGDLPSNEQEGASRSSNQDTSESDQPVSESDDQDASESDVSFNYI